jgi:hypothetical protein
VVHKLPADLREALIANTAALDAWKDITVQFVNAAAHDYTVAAGSPCQGFGVQGTRGP